MVKTSLYNYSDSYILVKESITIVGQEADTATIAAGSSSYCISEINKI